MNLATSPLFCPAERQSLKEQCVETTYKFSLSRYPLIFLDQVTSVIHRAGVREVLFNDRGHFIEGSNWTPHEHLRNTRHEEVEAVVEQLEWLEQIADGTMLPEKRTTGCIEC